MKKSASPLVCMSTGQRVISVGRLRNCLVFTSTERGWRHRRNRHCSGRSSVVPLPWETCEGPACEERIYRGKPPRANAAAFPSRASRRPAGIRRALKHSGIGGRSYCGRRELVWRAPCLVSSSALASGVDPLGRSALRFRRGLNRRPVVSRPLSRRGAAGHAACRRAGTRASQVSRTRLPAHRLRSIWPARTLKRPACAGSS